MQSPRRILIVRPSALGDVCRSVPLLVTLRRAYPDAIIDWLVQDEYAPAIRAHPDLDEVVPFPRARFARWWRDPRVAREMIHWFGGLRRRGYDLVVDCQGLGRSGLITWSTRAPRRVGHRDARELAWLGYNVRHPPATQRHTVARMMSLLTAEGLEPVWDMRLHVDRDDESWWHHRREELGVGDPYAVLAPTGRWESKRWPADRWSAIARPLRERGFAAILIVGSPSERRQVSPIVRAARDAGVLDLTGGATIGRTMAVIAGSALVIANDSAPLHMAVGFDRPCVGLFGPTDPEVVGPFGMPLAVVRRVEPGDGPAVRYRSRRLGAALMERISPQDVVERVDAILQALPPVAPASPDAEAADGQEARRRTAARRSLAAEGRTDSPAGRGDRSTRRAAS
jgi:lipopolysaccharide heptosyltransferase I